MIKLRKFIRESIQNIIEAKQHTDDEIVDFDEMDLQYEFDKLNGLLFGGSLKSVEMVWNTRRTAHGTVKFTRNRMTGEIKIRFLGISKFYDVPYKIFKDTLAHEMIHVYLIQNGTSDGHGPNFIREMNRINSKGMGFDVSVTRDSSKLEVSKHVQTKAKELVLVIVETDKQKNMVAVTSKNIFQREGNKIEALYSRVMRSGKYNWVKGEFFLSKNPKLLKFPQQRSFDNKFSYMILNQEEVDELKADAVEIGSFRIP